MPSAYHKLLEAAIRQLEDLQRRGARFVAVAPGTLAALSRPAQRAAPPTAIAAAVDSKPPAPPARIATPPAPRPATKPPIENPSLLDVTKEKSRPKLEPEAKSAAFTDLRARAMVCVKCANLASSRKNVVFGVGSIDAELMFVGEAPGADEDQQGEPFVGRAGELLTKIILAMGLKREQVYIGNILKCRPDTPGQASGNRKPTSDEMKTCIPYLHEQIDLIQPRVLVALGGTALEGLLHKSGIMKLRGQWLTYRGIPLMPTYHPSYLLRNQSLTEKRRVWEDMLQVMEKLGMPISEKQRGFFLKG